MKTKMIWAATMGLASVTVGCAASAPDPQLMVGDSFPSGRVTVSDLRAAVSRDGFIHVTPDREIMLNLGSERVSLVQDRVVLNRDPLIRLSLGTVDGNGAAVVRADAQADPLRAAVNARGIDEAQAVTRTGQGVRLQGR